jgi:hypothetical protein
MLALWNADDVSGEPEWSIEDLEPTMLRQATDRKSSQHGVLFQPLASRDSRVVRDEAMSGMLIDAMPYYPDVAQAVARLTERDLRNDVLPRLLRRLYYMDVRVLHGPREEGKDLLAWRMSEIDTTEWVGFVVKTGDITAQVAAVSGIRTVLHQVEQVLDHEIIDPLTSERSQVRGCWVVTTGRILPHALGDASATMRRHHLDKLIRWVDGAALTRLLSERLPRQALVQMLHLTPATIPDAEGNL